MPSNAMKKIRIGLVHIDFKAISTKAKKLFKQFKKDPKKTTKKQLAILKSKLKIFILFIKKQAKKVKA